MNECLQLVRDGSIEGRKQEKVSICYTPWYNLKKTASMEVGEVGFKDDKALIADQFLGETFITKV